MKLKLPRNYSDVYNFEIFDSESFTTLNSVEEELWVILDRLTNKDQANAFLAKSLGKTTAEVKNISPSMIEFVRQAKAYYLQAEKAESNVSPLLYYYGMLNLVKAFIVSRNPYLIVPRSRRNVQYIKLLHGISAGDHIKSDFDLNKENVLISNDGIFPHFYELLTGHKISSLTKVQRTMSVVGLMSYCVDISAEFRQVFRKRNTLPVVVKIVQENKIAWPILYINLSILKERSLDYKTLELRNPGISQYQRVRSDAIGFWLFEAKSPFKFSNNKNLKSQAREKVKSLKLSVSLGAVDKGLYEMPLINTSSSDILLPEVLNIYMAMYYFGSLVRYQPYAFKKILPTKEGWLTQSFVKTAPKKFLRLISNEIFQKMFTFDEV